MKRESVLALAVMMLIMVAGTAYAGTCTFLSPAASGTVSGTYNFNISVSDKTVQNCTLTGTSASSGDSWAVGVALNSSTDNTSNISVDSTGGLDAADWSFGATCVNSTGATIDTCTRTGIIVHNTVPTCVWNSAIVSNAEYKPTQTWTVTCGNTNTATLQFGANSKLTMTESSDVCTYTGDKSNIPTSAYDTVTVVTSDGTNTTSCSLTSIKIDEGAPLIEAAAIIASQQGVAKQAQSSGTGITTKTVLVVLGGVLAFMYFRKKK